MTAFISSRSTSIAANLSVASAQVAVNESNLAAARSNVASDQFDLTEKQRDYARAEELVKTAAISVQARDLALTAAQQSAADAGARPGHGAGGAPPTSPSARANEPRRRRSSARRGDARLHDAARAVRRRDLPCARLSWGSWPGRASRSSRWTISTMSGCART